MSYHNGKYFVGFNGLCSRTLSPEVYMADTAVSLTERRSVWGTMCFLFLWIWKTF